MDDLRLPTALWVEAHTRQLSAQGIPFYILNTGALGGGTVLLKLNGREKGIGLLIQQRDADGVLGWAHALGRESVEESEADSYIQRAVAR
ncbi:MAG: DUF1491 family protein, partial [Alphaproteobacteria bacterium]|nr:DUF1491 family protein [Alphaproteobacteria bacterium]